MTEKKKYSKGSGSDDKKEKSSIEGDEHFVWQDYLLVTNTEEVPPALFTHVEQSVHSGLQEGMMLEVPHKHNGSNYWVASIVVACGPLLQLRYVGCEGDRTRDFWCDVTKVMVRPLGWCKQHKIQLVPPAELANKLTNCGKLLDAALLDATTVPPHLLTGDGFTAVERVKQGMKLEVQDKRDPNRLWVATILENVGGRLLLRYDTPDSSSPDFWLFYTSHRLYQMDWAAEKGAPWYLKWPNSLKTSHGHEEWAAVMEMAKEDARRLPLPPDLFQNEPVSVAHKFEEGMKLEAVHPHNMAELCPATVVRVFNSCHFLVEIDSHSIVEEQGEDSTWLCTALHPYIFPPGWAKDHGLQLTHPKGWATSKEEFDWMAYLMSTKSRAAPRTCFHTRNSAKKLGFSPNMKLEAVNPENNHQICAATIVCTVDHLLWLHLESNDDFHPNHIVSTDSLDIFPVGWCDTNSYRLKPPSVYQMPTKAQLEGAGPDSKKEIVSSGSAMSNTTQKSSWCPKIYFNHKCFSGPYLSKGKLAQLPKAVGPGQVTLVMKEVLSMLISVAYKSSRVLKELQSDGKVPPGMYLEVLKAKFKTNAYRANVAVVTSADMVASFCQEVCKKLQVCPYLFGPVLIGAGGCPENCSTQSKTKFTQYWIQNKRPQGRPKGESSIIIGRPKKRGRKKITKAEEMKDKEKEKKTVEPINYTTLESPDNGSDESRAPSPNGSDCEASPRKKYRKREFPKTEIKTRGAKLPNFALQMRVNHWTRKKSDDSIDTAEQNNHRDSSRKVVTIEKKLDSHKSISPVIKEKSPINSLSEKSLDVKPRIHSTTETVELTENRTETTALATHGLDNMLHLHSNPLTWTKDDVYQFLTSTDCVDLADKCKEQLIDGHALMLLNLPTIQEYLCVKTGTALKLCYLIEKIKLAFYIQYGDSLSEP